MVRLMLDAELSTTVVAAGSLLTLAFGLVLGHRGHFWLWFHAPGIERHLPTDAGALLGLASAMAVLAA
ncbi:hypothetical protein ASG43_03250 [Aureimonas sp. Leaf454]|uniref:hypothetical protein n=1 Tax=Aureimonas sp. Leaf454 TaxID=1736381 RepID=UPI0006F493AF|nr:hypothetical protein [Aureimonas sp. Leaf454]KQT54616.1 hypothetical protein ASG43_03250 [Aureimonas sp. Leaf454]